jgi:uncharacterized protein (TIGR03437 family)
LNWAPTHSTANGTIAVRLIAVTTGGIAELLFNVNVSAAFVSPPILTPAGIVNAASFAPGLPMAPGELASIFGFDLADCTASASSAPLPTSLCDTQVLLGGAPLPILYAGASQINVQVPFDVLINTQHQILVERGGIPSVGFALSVADASPGIFVAVNAITGALANSANPLHPGNYVVVYCTGLGVVSPAVGTGQPAPSTEPLARTVNPVTMTIGGINAPILYAGLAPGFAGLYQVNAMVPVGVTAGNQAPVVISVAGQSSPAVSVSVVTP